MSSRIMRLTEELAALCHREVAEPEPDARYDYLTQADYEQIVARWQAERPPGPLWLFAYGSLIWKPVFRPASQRRAAVQGWQRAFSMKIESYRGTPEQPGYMMCLDRGGSCEGLVYEIAEAEVEKVLLDFLIREIGSNEALEGIRWTEAETALGPVTALTSYAAPELLSYYRAARPLEDIVQGLARACGHWGSGAAYLRNTVAHLEDMGIHDAGLWALQERVADEIAALYKVSIVIPQGDKGPP